jgi:hypothetical protein
MDLFAQPGFDPKAFINQAIAKSQASGENIPLEVRMTGGVTA